MNLEEGVKKDPFCVTTGEVFRLYQGLISISSGHPMAVNIQEMIARNTGLYLAFSSNRGRSFMIQ